MSSTRARWGYLVIATLIAAAVASLAIAANAPSTAEARGYWKQCGSQNARGAGWYDAKAHRVNCESARRVARRWTHGQNDPGPGRWLCDYDSIGDELGKVKCTREQRGRVQVVKFKVGA